MIRSSIAETRILASWQAYQDALVQAVAPLRAEQMQRRPVAGQRTPGEVAEHIVFGRAFWLTQVLGEEAVGMGPLLSWDDPDDPPRTAAEVVQGLEITWRLLVATLMQGAAAGEVVEERVQVLQTLWGLLDHDLPHAGELSLLLGGAGLPGVEI